MFENLLTKVAFFLFSRNGGRWDMQQRFIGVAENQRGK
jgi:hypothetical protein